MKELKKVTQMLGTMLTKEEIEDFMAEADKDGNGKLDYDEFVKMLLQYWYWYTYIINILFTKSQIQ